MLVITLNDFFPVVTPQSLLLPGGNLRPKIVCMGKIIILVKKRTRRHQKRWFTNMWMRAINPFSV